MSNEDESATVEEPRSHVHAVEARFQSRRRRGFGVALLCGLAILAVSWILRSPEDWFIEWIYPLYGMVIFLLFLLSRRDSLALHRFESTGYSLIASLIFFRLLWHFMTGEPIEERMVSLAGGHYWSIGVLIVGAFVVFDLKAGMWFGGVVFALSAVITLCGLVFGESVDGFGGPATYQLLRVHVFLIALLALSSAIAVVKRNYLQAVVRAQVMDRWANTDVLTGIANRRAGDEFLRRRLMEASRHDRPLAVIMVDVDNFKAVNDGHGHAMGDEVLVQAALRMSEAIRHTDHICRWGGEEFLIVCPETTAEDAVILAERCRELVRATSVNGVPVTATFGVAEFHGGDSIETLVQRVDAALYDGKLRGKDRVCIAGTRATGSALRR